MSITERFLRYTRFDTQSDENSDTCPSTEGQMVFARFLRDELTEIGLQDVELDEYGYLYATLPASPGMEAVPTIGFIAHLDTSPDCCGTGVHPRIIRNYHGDDIVLDAEAGIVTSTMQFPELNRHFGEDLIVTDGHTLLGADDKAGIAAIVEAMVYMMAHPEVQHGRIRVGFNPDEEIGRGAHRFDIERFGAAWAYTIDGSEVGELEFENFNAAAADVVFRGVSVHPGYAKGKLQNSMLAATAFINAMPADERPETTEGYEGFYHLVYMKGGVEETTLHYIIRDHDRKRFEARKQFVADLAAEYGGTAAISDTYYNMREVVEPQMHIIDIARQAMKQTGVECRIQAIRGGTDGAQLSFRGLPCPNIFAGGVNFHGPHEFLPIPSLEKAMKVIVAIANGVIGL